MVEQQELRLSWDDVHRDSLRLADEVKNRTPYRDFGSVIAISRGGLFPALILSQVLGLHSIDTFCVSSYKGLSRSFDGEPRLLKCPTSFERSDEWLIVDDLVDTGQTFQFIRRFCPGSLYCCIYAKPQGLRLTDIYARPSGQNTWIVFPWEV